MRREPPGGGKWVRAIQSRSCCPRQPCALVSVRAHRASRSASVRGGEESSCITKVLRMHTTTCTLVCFQRTMHVDACERWALRMPLFALHFDVLALRTKGSNNRNTLGETMAPANRLNGFVCWFWLTFGHYMGIVVSEWHDALKPGSCALAVNRNIIIYLSWIDTGGISVVYIEYTWLCKCVRPSVCPSVCLFFRFYSPGANKATRFVTTSQDLPEPITILNSTRRS